MGMFLAEINRADQMVQPDSAFHPERNLIKRNGFQRAIHKVPSSGEFKHNEQTMSIADRLF